MNFLIYIFHSLSMLICTPDMLVVDPGGKGDFTNIQPAVEYVKQHPDIKKIFVKNGLYVEKIFIDSLIDGLSLEGESKEGVIIRYTQSRDIWRCIHSDDYGAAVINVKGRNLKFSRLTVINDYGRLSKDTTVLCPNHKPDVGEKTNDIPHKTVGNNCHQFAFRSFPGATKIVWEYCDFISDGGDTVSPWDVENGMYYMKHCTVKGHVDAWCPRGYALAEHCSFYGYNKHAFIWHDGIKNPDSKSVLKHCHFDGVEGFALGRYHKDCQLYLFDCTFSENMADKAIYQAGNGPLPHGHRVYYKNCKKEGEPYAWYQDNTDLKTEEITFSWVFGDRWKEKEIK